MVFKEAIRSIFWVLSSLRRALMESLAIPGNVVDNMILSQSDDDGDESDFEEPKPKPVGILTVDKLLQKKAYDSISSNVSGRWIDNNLASKKALLPMTVIVDGMSINSSEWHLKKV